MKIKVGEYEVYESGTIVSIKNQPVQFHIHNLTYVLSFVNDPSQGTSVSVEEHPNRTGMTLLFINFNSSVGYGNVVPLPLGFINDKDLFFNYTIIELGYNPTETDMGPGKTIHYTWLTKKR